MKCYAMTALLAASLLFGADSARLTFEPSFKQDDSAYLVDPVDLALDKQRKLIYVLDMQSSVVNVFDRTGKLVNKFGRKGVGPGEFLKPTAIGVLPDGGVVVGDPMRGLLLFFDGNGKPGIQIKCKGTRAASLLTDGDKGFFAMYGRYKKLQSFSMKSRGDEPVGHYIDRQGNIAYAFGTGPKISNPMAAAAARTGVLAQSPDKRLFVFYTLRTDVDVYLDGKHQRSFTLGLPFKPVDPSGKMKEMNGQRMIIPTEDITVLDAAFTEDGKLYATAYKESTSRAFREQRPAKQILGRFDAETGERKQTLDLSLSIPVFDFLEGNLAVMIVNDDGEYDVRLARLN
ncbi:MAG: 6-bladed beta-propeller [Acidobacteriota bacterium]|nr:6-bladed beta-propeller [Acidobacteriota bacterium]